MQELQGAGELAGELAEELARELYSSYYTLSGWIVDLFEQSSPWTNFYDAIEQADIDMYLLVVSLKDSKDWPPWRPSGYQRSTEITLRLLYTIDEVLGIDMSDSYVSWCFMNG